jgi:hypothetical protein
MMSCQRWLASCGVQLGASFATPTRGRPDTRAPRPPSISASFTSRAESFAGLPRRAQLVPSIPSTSGFLCLNSFTTFLSVGDLHGLLPKTRVPFLQRSKSSPQWRSGSPSTRAASRPVSLGRVSSDPADDSPGLSASSDDSADSSPGPQNRFLDDLFSAAISGGNTDAAKDARALLNRSFFTKESNRVEAAARQDWCFRVVGTKLRALAAEMQLEYYSDEPSHEAKESVDVLLSAASWLFQLPDLGAKLDVKKAVLDLMLDFQRRCGTGVYESLFGRHIAETIYLPLAKAVHKGHFVIDEERRLGLLRMWVYVDKWRPYNMDRVDKEFAALLSKLPRAEQESVLEKWMPKLLLPDRTYSGWQPWFKAWLEEAF